MKKMIADILAKNILCVYGNEKRLEKAGNLFDKLIKVVE
jgi:hypothetical protein